MIHIIEVNFISGNISRDMINYVGKNIPKYEYKFICDIDDKDGDIYVMPHEKSLLRKHFIQVFINNDGHIDRYSFRKVFEAVLKERKFKYIIIDKKCQ